MIKYVILLKRRPEIDHATFLKIWREEHTPILQQLPGIRSIELNSTLDVPNYAPDYDGIGLLTFDSMDAANAAFAGPAGQAARQHTPTFADSANAMRFFAEPLETD